MKSSLRFTSLLATAVCIAAFGTACGDDDDGGSASASEPSDTTITADGVAQPATAATQVDGINADGAGTVPGETSDDNVVNGASVKIEERPWTVALVSPGETDNFCGGVLIAPTLVVTAAHCVEHTFKEDGKDVTYINGPASIEVVAGRTVLSDEGGQRVKVTKVLQSEQWDGDAFVHDYALLYLAEPINQTTIAIPGNDETDRWAPDVRVHVSGWGCQEPDTPWPACEDTGGSPLMTTTFAAVDGSTCAAKHENGFDTETNLCLLAESPDTNSCSGDSGGPYTVRTNGGTWYLVAVVSYVVLGCKLGEPVGGALLAPIVDGDGQLNDYKYIPCENGATWCTKPGGE